MPLKEAQIYPLSESVRRVIGKGISFPFTFSARGKSRQVDLGAGVEKINQSIHMILSTRPGERMYLPEYGSHLPDLVFEPEDQILYDSLYEYTVDALDRWEKRIRVENVTIMGSEYLSKHYGTDNSFVGIQIDYVILSGHVQGSYVFPFQMGAIPLEETTIALPRV